MASREQSYLPDYSNVLLVPVDPADGAIFRRRVRTIKSLITELEDENNLIAYKITKTRRRIAEKKAAIEAEQLQVPEHRGFWGASARKSTATLASPATSVLSASAAVGAEAGAGAKSSPVKAPARKRDRTKSGRAKKEAEAAAAALAKSAPTTIAPLSAEELAYLGNGRPPAEQTSESDHAAPPARDQASQGRTADAMEVDELDDY